MATCVLGSNHIGKWISEKPAVLDDWTHEQLNVLRSWTCHSIQSYTTPRKFAPVIQEFQQLIENDPDLFMHFHKMFDEVRQPSDGFNRVGDYRELMAILDQIIAQAPKFGGVNNLVMGVPMYAVLAPFCNTPSGYSAFVNPKVNAQFHKIFAVWAEFLVSPASCAVLTTREGGWFSPAALSAMTARLGMGFYDAWLCAHDDPDQHYGFVSWDDFFTRRFRPGMRPLVEPNNLSLISAACEAEVHAIQHDVKAVDTFWIKGHHYSLAHIFARVEFVPKFVGGTVYQAILGALDYHHWHSPVSGVVREAYRVPGTYYAARLDRGADAGLDADVVSRSQDFVTAIATRALIFIEADNPEIGLMCFVAVGLGEVSTCEIGVRVGDKVQRGDRLGVFRFGGSTHCLVFRPQTKLRAFPHVKPGTVQKVNTNIFYVEN